MMSKFRSSVWEVVKFVVITLIIVVPIRTFVAQPFIVSGASMDPTFRDGQYLIVDELSYYFRPPTRDEVVVFKYPKDPSKHFIKRISGLPGETVTIAGTKQVLGPDEYFVMGDNRLASLDSRSWGALPARLITGRVLARLFPLNQIGLWPGVIAASD